MMALVPELGRANLRSIASLVGFAPHARESDAWRRRRSCWGGRAGVRAVPYMTTIAAMRWNPVVGGTYQRLHDAGRPIKGAVVACMRRHLAIMNLLLKTKKR